MKILLAVLLLSATAFSQVREKGGRLTAVHTPAVSEKASIVIAAGAAGVKHVVDCVSFSAGSTTAPVLTKLTIDVKDGSTVKQQWTVVIPASTGQNVAPFSVCGLNITGTAATAVTVEFSALLTNLFETVGVTYYSIN
jgi:hypothetical protein